MIAVVISMAPPSQGPASFLEKQYNSLVSFKFTQQFSIFTQPVLLPGELERNRCRWVLSLLALSHIFSAQDCLCGVREMWKKQGQSLQLSIVQTDRNISAGFEQCEEEHLGTLRVSQGLC